MKVLFKISKRSEAHKGLRTAAKIAKIIHIILACIFTILFLIEIIVMADYGVDVGVLLLYLLCAVAGFFLILFIGWVIELMLLGFSNIAENQYDELVVKNKVEKVEIQETNKTDTVYNRLQQLYNLKNAGIITEEEYEEKKKETLKGM